MKPVLLLSLFVCTLAFGQWEPAPEIPGNRTVYSLLVVHDTLYAGTDSLVYVGANAGTQWSSGTPPVVSPDAVACMAKVSNVLVVGTILSGIFKSTNDGLSWQPFSAGLSGLGATDVSNLVVWHDSLIAGTLGASVFATPTDLSHAWAPFGDSLANYQGDNVFKMLSVGGAVLAGAGGNGYMFRYTEAQPWWNPISINTPQHIGQYVSGMASSATAVIAGTSAGIYRSTNEGLSWELANATIPPSSFGILPVLHDSTFFAVTTTPLSSSLLRSSDDGATWESLGEFPMGNVLDVAVIGENFYLGRPAGLWRAQLSALLTTAVEKPFLPSAFRLRQNFPNPFNPGTTISYQLPTRSRVVLTIFDLLGREVATPVNAAQDPGYKSVSIDASRWPSGVYFYRLRAGDYVETKKLVILR